MLGHDYISRRRNNFAFGFSSHNTIFDIRICVNHLLISDDNFYRMARNAYFRAIIVTYEDCDRMIVKQNILFQHIYASR